MSSLTSKRQTLEEQIIYHKRRYYHGAAPEISDAEYDALEQQLQALDSTSPALKVGAIDPQSEHSLLMYVGSLDKIYPEEFDTKFPSYAKGEEFVVYPKLDGYALLIHWGPDGRLVSVCTRDGYKGKDKTYLAVALGIPLFLDSAASSQENHFLRVEMILPISVFNAKYAGDFANPRNALNSIIASKTISPMVNDVHLIGHHWMLPRPSHYRYAVGFIEVMAPLAQTRNGWIPDQPVDTPFGAPGLVTILREARESMDYEIDGLVIIPNSLNKFTFPDGKDPDFMVAFKENTQFCEAEVEDIQWEPTAYGKLFPTLIIKKVKLGGVEIRNVTAHHAKLVYDNKIGAGTRILLTRGGDVIPKIERIIEAKGDLIEAPSYFYPEWEGVHLRIGEEAGVVDSVEIKKIYQFFKALEIDGVAESMIERMYGDAGLTTVAKVITATVKDFMGLRRVQLKLATNIYNAIRDGLKRVTPAKLMVGSCCFESVGRRLSQKIMQEFAGSLDDLLSITDGGLRMRLLSIDGIGPEFADAIYDGMDDFKMWYSEIKDFLVVQEQPLLVSSPAAGGGRFAGFAFCFTGYRSDPEEALIIANGGEIKSGVSSKVTHLLVANKRTTSSKAEKARLMGIAVIDSDDLAAMLA